MRRTKGVAHVAEGVLVDRFLARTAIGRELPPVHGPGIDRADRQDTRLVQLGEMSIALGNREVGAGRRVG